MRRNQGMRTGFFGFVCACLLPQFALAADKQFDELSVGDDIYHDVTVTGVTATDVYFTHATGMGTAKLKNLEPKVQRELDFDPRKAAEVEATRQQGAAVYSALMQRQRRLEWRQAEIERRRAAQEREIEARRAELKARQLQNGNAGLVNQPAPRIEVEQWLTRAPTLKGKFVLIDFWATWCGPCRDSISHLNDLHRRFSNRMVIVGLSAEPAAEVRKMTKPKIQYHSAIDTKARTATAVGVRAIPHALLVDPQGIVRYQGHPAALSEEAVESILTRFGS